MLIHELIPAARQLAGWSQNDLSAATGLTQAAIANIENGKASPQQVTIEKMIKALNLAGVEFMDDGVRKPNIKSYYMPKIDDWYISLLDDVYVSTRDLHFKELIIYGVDDRKTPDHVIEKFRYLRKAGIKMRFFIEQRSTFYRGAMQEYRYIPSQHYANLNTFVYANKVCNDLGDGIQIIINKNWADAERNKLNVLWDLCIPVTNESTADVRY